MQERARDFFFRFFLILESSLTFVNDSDFLNLPGKKFLLRKPQKLSFGDISKDADLKAGVISSFLKSLSVFEVFIAKTSLIKSGWLFSIDREDVLCSIKLIFLHALACGNELGRMAKECLCIKLYIPPERSSRNSSSSEPDIRSSARDDCRERDCKELKNIRYNTKKYYK
jgi:hypothetical protein